MLNKVEKTEEEGEEVIQQIVFYPTFLHLHNLQ